MVWPQDKQDNNVARATSACKLEVCDDTDLGGIMILFQEKQVSGVSRATSARQQVKLPSSKPPTSNFLSTFFSQNHFSFSQFQGIEYIGSFLVFLDGERFGCFSFGKGC